MIEPEFLTLDEAAVLLRFDQTSRHPRRQCLAWLKAERIPMVRRGRVLLVRRSLLLAALRTFEVA